MNATSIDQFFKSNKPNKRILPNEGGGSQANSDSQGSIPMRSNDDPAIEEQQKLHRPFVYILPCHIGPVWQKVSKNLKSIQNKECQIGDVIDLMKENYNSHFTKYRNVNLKNLEEFFDLESKSRLEYYQNTLLPYIAELALMVTELFEDTPILMMHKGEFFEQKFTKSQIASFLANLFFMTLHEQPCRQNEDRLPFECSQFYYKSENPATSNQINVLRKEKIKFLLAYFESFEKKRVNGDLIVAFERLGINENKKRLTTKLIQEIDKEMTPVEVHDDKLIEESGTLIQINFANKSVGGGSLTNGSLQEEINYLTNPECLMSMFIFEELDEDEAILIQGTQQISNYSGYSKTLKFTGLHDSSQLQIQEQNNMLNSVIVGIDAYNFNQNSEEKKPQFSIPMYLRELRKAEVGFSCSDNVLLHKRSNQKRGIITGNWGCGDFQGDKELKFMIQWIAASISAVKVMHFCTNNDTVQKIEVEEIIELLKDYYVSQVFKFVREFIAFRSNNPKSDMSLFLYLTTFVN